MRLSRLIVLLPALVLPVSAVAQEFIKREPVRRIADRYDPYYEPLGIRGPGQFILSPELHISETYDDNIFRTDGNEESDFITQVKPGLRVQSDWNNHEMLFIAGGDFGYYADHSDENYEDYRLEARGRLDILRATYLTGLLRYDRLHEDRSSPDDVRGDEPTEIDVITSRIGFARELARLQFSGYAQRQDLDFNDAQRGNVTIRNDARNRSQDRLEAQVSYELSPNYDAFIRGAYNERRYDDTSSNNRNSDGYEAVVGSAIDISGKAKGEVYIGYLKQEYNQLFDDLSGVNYGGSLLWNVTGLTSLYGEVERVVNETTISFATAIIRTRYELTAEHALYRNLFLIASGEYIEDDYSSFIAGQDREDEYLRGALAAEYRLNRNLHLRGGYDYAQRDSTAQGEDYTSNRFLVSAEIKF